MVHFVFYAGDAYSEKVNLIKKVESINKYFPYIFNTYYSDKNLEDKAMFNAIKHGYWQERLDSLYPPAKHSAYSYEDLPSDRYGAEFGAKYFNPKSNLSLGKQVSNYLKKLGATNPKNAPNYNTLPNIDNGSHSGIKNKTTKPFFTKEDK